MNEVNVASVDPRVNSGTSEGGGTDGRRGWTQAEESDGGEGGTELGARGSRLDHGNGRCHDREVPCQGLQIGLHLFFPLRFRSSRPLLPSVPPSSLVPEFTQGSTLATFTSFTHLLLPPSLRQPLR